MRGLVVLLVWSNGCDEPGGREAEATATRTPDVEVQSDDEDPNCHWDCFGGTTCQDGVVTRYAHTPVPCRSWTGACPIAETYTCERGCSTKATPFASEAADACEENRPKEVGDPCSAPEHCDPQVATVVEDTVTNVYLRCDLELGACVARPPTEVADWLAPCGQTVPFGDPGREYGFVRTDLCASGLCLIYDQDTCVKQGCTAACDSDDDCPLGAICQTDGFNDWTQSGAGEAYYGGVCKPGPRNEIGVGLSCPE